MITGSYCDRILDQCDRKLCRVQSPNFPGAYPRNVTCYYRIEQRTAPKSKRALIVVRQPNAHKIHIKDQVINYDRSQRTLRYVYFSILLIHFTITFVIFFFKLEIIIFNYYCMFNKYIINDIMYIIVFCYTLTHECIKLIQDVQLYIV